MFSEGPGPSWPRVAVEAVPCCTHTVMEQELLHPGVPGAGRAEEGLSPLHHTDVESNCCCLSTETASFSHGGERKPKIQTVTVRLAHCYMLGQEHIYNSSCDIVLSVS